MPVRRDRMPGMKVIRDIVSIDDALCNGCGNCVRDCAEGAIEVVNGKARVIADIYCDGLGACLEGCPAGALTIIRREAAAYDEAAVEKLLERQGSGALPAAHGSREDSNRGVSADAPGRLPAPSRPGKPAPGSSSLPAASPACGSFFHSLSGGEKQTDRSGSQWPLKLRLLPPDAPFLRNVDILLAADCTAFACGHFQEQLRQGRALLIACPKFEGAEPLARHMEAVFRQARPKSCVVARMEVPCCRMLSKVCEEAARMSGAAVPVREIVIARDGEILDAE